MFDLYDAEAVTAFIAGVDLASQAAQTGLAVLSADDSTLRVEKLDVGVDDSTIIETVAGSVKTGVDVPLGWPERFVDLVSAHYAGRPQQCADWRTEAVLRLTDRVLKDDFGLRPLSVSTDRIAYPALRWSGIEAQLKLMGIDTARDGSGRVCEVYPAGFLYQHGLKHRGYKGASNAQVREEILGSLRLVMSREQADLCVADDNALDAVLAALSAHKVMMGKAYGPPEEHRQTALREGWIWMPFADR